MRGGAGRGGFARGGAVKNRKFCFMGRGGAGWSRRGCARGAPQPHRTVCHNDTTHTVSDARNWSLYKVSEQSLNLITDIQSIAKYTL